MKHYYAKDNSYASQTDVGFCNTWYVVKFALKSMRDLYARRDDSLAAEAITALEARKIASPSIYVDAEGEAWDIDSEGFTLHKGEMLEDGRIVSAY